MLCIVPSVTLALGGFAMAELRYASGLFNLMRNLGGAIGIAVVNTWLGDFARIHVQRFGEATAFGHSRVREAGASAGGPGWPRRAGCGPGGPDGQGRAGPRGRAPGHDPGLQRRLPSGP
jgi:hypothetical protein